MAHDLTDVSQKLWARMPSADVATDLQAIERDDDLAHRLERFMRAQVEHAGLDFDDLADYAGGMARDVLQRAHSPEAAYQEIYSAVMWSAVISSLVATGLDPADVNWDDDIELDTTETGGYVHSNTGAIVRLDGVTDDGQYLVRFDAELPGERTERWCADHFHERFVPISEVPILGGEK